MATAASRQLPSARLLLIAGSSANPCREVIHCAASSHRSFVSQPRRLAAASASLIGGRGIAGQPGRLVSARALSRMPLQPAASTLIPGFQKAVDICNDASEARAGFLPFSVEGKTVGWLAPSFVTILREFPTVFEVDSAGVSLSSSLRTFEERNSAVAGVLAKLRDRGDITGWRDELFPVLESFSSAPVLLVERAAAAMFGIKAYGVHVNGFVERPDGSHLMWVARRSKTKQTWPGMLDHIVAGGQPHGISPQENVLKECGEEAGVPEGLAAAAQPAGAVSYECLDKGRHLKRDVMFVYDLKLPEDFVPEPQDGEVEEFYLWTVDQVMQAIAEGNKYKPNVSLVIIDFLIRRGYITPEQPGYLELLASLRSGECS